MKNKKIHHEMKNIKMDIKSKRKNMISLFKYIFIIFLFPLYISKKRLIIRKLNFAYEIIVTIKGTGEKLFLSTSSMTRPERATPINAPGTCNIYTRKCTDLTTDVTNISMIWNNKPTNFYRLFFYCEDVTHIYFSNCDTSKVQKMDEMFRGCSSLEYVDFTNFNTSSTTNMNQMFSGCSLTSVDLSSFDTSKVTTMIRMFESTSFTSLNLSTFVTSSLETMEYMFTSSSKLKTIDLSSFDTSKVTLMSSAFFGCRELESLDLTNFDTSKVENMGGMFRECYLLKSLDLSHFVTSSTTSMTGMFQEAKSLISLNLSNFETSNVKSMDNMFYNCNSLKDLDVSNFDTSEVINMDNMFYDCSSLTTLDLSNFETPSLTSTKSLFLGCTSLISLNINNFDTSHVLDMSLMFYNCYSLISLNLINFDTSSVASTCHHIFTNINPIFCSDDIKIAGIAHEITFINSCSNDCFSNNHKIIVNEKKCTLNCSIDDTYKLEYNNICYEKCPNDTHVSFDNMFLCQIFHEGYYLENDIYKKCYSSCKTCNGEGNDNEHNCINCISNYIFLNETGKEKNCYKKCDYYYYFEINGNYICTTSNKCEGEHNKTIKEKGKCINDCNKDDTYIFEYNNICYKNCPNNTYASTDNNHSCLNDPDNYYLDTNIYKPCYSTCKRCSGEGNYINNNCISCKLDHININESNKQNNCYPSCDYYYYFDNYIYKCTQSNECPEGQSKFINEKKKCIDNCTNDDIYKLEYDNKCFQECPNNTHLTIDNNYLCQRDIEGYYLDNDNIYKHCFELCKKCNIGGNESNHNCEECISNYKFINDGGIKNNCYQICDHYYFDSSGYHCASNNECPEGQSKYIKNKSLCIDNCTNDDTYKFEYNNICYETCPNDTHVTNENNYLCQLNPEGYYLEGGIYKHCFELCKKCSEEGNENSHNCDECIMDYVFIVNGGIEKNCYLLCEFYYFDSSGYHCNQNNECPEERNKFIKDKNFCIDNCTNDSIYKVEYNNICYENCPNNTYLTIDNNYLCQLNPDGYYLEDNIYKKCYPSCKTCNGEGNNINHNCINCISNYIFINETGKENNCYEKCDNYYYFDNSGNYQCTTNNVCEGEFNKLIPLKKKCIDKCKNDNIYIVEYNNTCLQNCPNGYNITEENNVLICTKNPEDSNINKPCYELCQVCVEKGTVYNHKCQECIENYNFLNETGKEGNCYQKCDYYYYFDSYDNYICTESNICPKIHNKLINEKQKCIDNCSNDNTYKREYNNICYVNCPKDTYLTIENSYLCQKNPKGYYLENNIYKPCYKLCESCNGEGDDKNNNCIECISNYELILNPDNITNCYKKCDNYYYFNNSGNYHCTINKECPEEQKKLIQEKSKCIDDCSKDEIFIFEDNNICVKFSPDKKTLLICQKNLPFQKNNECIETCSAYDFLTKECKLNNKENREAESNMIKIIQEGIKNGDLADLISDIIEEKKDYTIDDTNSIYQVTSSENQYTKEYNNISTIFLGDCEKKLKKHYKIDEDETLIIFKVDIHKDGLLIPLVEYEVYNPINLEPLNLSFCEDKKIGISIPVEIDEKKLFKYNSSHEYYNDICYPYTTDSGTDIVVKDRQNEFISNNLSLCESNCEYINYNLTSKKAECECSAKLNLNSIEDIKDNKDILLKTFMDITTFINFDILKCHNIFFIKEGFLTNMGSYTLLSIMSIHLISLIIFKIKGFRVIYNIIQNLVKQKIQNIKTIHIHNKIKPERGRNLPSIYIKNKGKKKLTRIKLNKKLKKRKLNNPPYKKRKNKISNKGVNEENASKSNSKLDLNFSEKKLSHKKLSQKIPFIIKKKTNINEKKKNAANKDKNRLKQYINNLTITNYNDYELNNLLYVEALEIDKRRYSQYYISLLKQKHLFIFAFITKNDFNSRIIKISLFFFSFSLYLTVNALFFTYSTMNKIYEENGSYNFIFQIPQILYSNLICTTINIIVKTFSLSEKNIVELKREKENILFKAKKIINCLTIKFALFFLISFIFLVLFWYYLGCFCAVYKNTQGHLIKDALISFGLSLVYPFFINLLPGIFRIPSLKSVHKNKEGLYKLSQILQFI